MPTIEQRAAADSVFANHAAETFTDEEIIAAGMSMSMAKVLKPFRCPVCRKPVWEVLMDRDDMSIVRCAECSRHGRQSA